MQNPLGNFSSQVGSQNIREASHSIPGTIAMVTCLALFILKIILWGEYAYPFILVHGLAASPRAFRCTHMQRLMLKCPVFLNCSPAYCLRKGLSLNLEFTPSARLVDQQVSKNCLHIPRFYMDPGDPNSILTVHEKPLTL